MARDDFSKRTKSLVSERASFHCSRCKLCTLSASKNNTDKSVNIGIVAHITAASDGGPRFDENMSVEERISDSNAIFLCENCASAIDKNKGVDFSVAEIKQWKEDHEEWTRANLSLSNSNPGLQLLDVCAHLESGEFPAIDIKMLNGHDRTVYFTKGKVTTLDRFIVPGDRHAAYEQIDWTYVVEVSPDKGGVVEFGLSQALAPNSAERFALAIKGEFPHYGDAVSLNLYQLRIELFEGEELRSTLPDVIVHIPRDGRVLALTRPPYSAEQYAEFLTSMAGKSREVLSRLTSSIEAGTKLCCDYEVADALMKFSQVDKQE